MTAFADASFLVAAFAPSDEHNRIAWRWWVKWDAAIIASRLAIFEAENTIRGFPVAGKCSLAAAEAALEGIKRAILEGVIKERDIVNKRLLPHARRVSQHYTITRTYGALDIIHVATALEFGATTFLSFDKRQCELAEAEGLVVQP